MKNDLHHWRDLNQTIISKTIELLQLQTEITELDSKCILKALLNQHTIKQRQQYGKSLSDDIQTGEICIRRLELSLFAQTGILYRHPTPPPSYSAQTYHDEIELLGNNVPTLLALLELSMNTDPVLIDLIQEQSSCAPENYWAHVLQHYQRLYGTLLPPTQWGYECSMQAYKKNQVMTLPRETRLLRTLQYGKTSEQKNSLTSKKDKKSG